jgi:hypothetical protein
MTNKTGKRAGHPFPAAVALLQPLYHPAEPGAQEYQVRRMLIEYRWVTEARDAMIREAGDCGIGQRQTAKMMGISRPTVARVLAARLAGEGTAG